MLGRCHLQQVTRVAQTRPTDSARRKTPPGPSVRPATAGDGAACRSFRSPRTLGEAPPRPWPGTRGPRGGPDLQVTLATALAPVGLVFPPVSSLRGRGGWPTGRALPVPPIGPRGLRPTCSGLQVRQGLSLGHPGSAPAACCPGTGGHASLAPLCVPLPRSHHSSRDGVLAPTLQSRPPHCGQCWPWGASRGNQRSAGDGDQKPQVQRVQQDESWPASLRPGLKVPQLTTVWNPHSSPGGGFLLLPLYR